MMVEGFRHFATMLSPPEMPHHVMEGPNGIVIELESLPGFMRELLHGSNIDVVGGEKILRLCSCFRLEIVERKLFAAA